MTTPYRPEVIVGEGELAALAEQMNREFRRIADSLETTQDFEDSRQPAKTQDGLLRHFVAATFDPGSGTGLYFREGGSWKKITMV